MSSDIMTCTCVICDCAPPGFNRCSISATCHVSSGLVASDYVAGIVTTGTLSTFIFWHVTGGPHTYANAVTHASGEPRLAVPA